jgi:solute carrier family 35 protein E3
MNLNLQANSVGIYQISKMACIPVTLAVQYVFYKQYISISIAATLVPLTIGVYMATVYDVEANFQGTIYATCAVLATSLSQIFTRYCET